MQSSPAGGGTALRTAPRPLGTVSLASHGVAPRPRPAAPALGDLGLVVPLHQARCRRARAGGRRLRPHRRRGSRCSLPLLACSRRVSRRSAAPRRPLVVLGALNNALPFWLLGFAETRIDSGLAAVIQAAAPIFTVLLAHGSIPSQAVRGAAARRHRRRLRSAWRCSSACRGRQLVGALAVLGTALCYAVVRPLSPDAPCVGLPPLQVSVGQLACRGWC